MNTASPEDAASKASPTERTPKGWHDFWEKELSAFQKRSRRFRKQGVAVVNRFLDERKGRDSSDPADNALRGTSDRRLNLFYKNTNTLMNMLYGQTPRQDVSREHQDANDDVARVAALLLKRILEADYQPSGEDVSCVLKSALQDYLLPGMGVARVKYDATFGTEKAIDPKTFQVTEFETLENETADIVYEHWQDVAWGWSRSWKNIPWFGFRVYLDQDAATKRFGKKKADKLEYKLQTPNASDDKTEGQDSDLADNIAKAEIWEFWCKADRRVYYYSGGAELVLESIPDPLQLEGFWPMPRPLMANTTTTLLMPKANFAILQDLYNEIDILQARIASITKSVKVVGVYDDTAEGLKRMLKEGTENDLIPVKNWAMFAEKGGLQAAIGWFPVQEVVGVLQTLNEVQKERIEQLNHLSGMSEIMRGSAGGQYTAAASNQLAAQFGSIDVQALQEEFARFASDLSAIKAEVVSKLYEPKSIVQQSNAQFLMPPDQQYLMPAIQLLKTPDIRWRVSIRPETIAMIDYAQLKTERAEYLNTVSTYVQSAQAMAKVMPQSMPVLLELMKWGLAGFKGSDQIEGVIDQAIQDLMKNPPQSQEQQQESAAAQEAAKQQTLQLQAQLKMQTDNNKLKNDVQLEQVKTQSRIQEMEADMRADQSTAEKEHSLAMLASAREHLQTLKEIAANLNADIQVENVQALNDIASQDNDHQNTMREIQANKTRETAE